MPVLSAGRDVWEGVLYFCCCCLTVWAFANGYDQKKCSSNLSIWNDVQAGYSCPRSFCLWVRKKRFSFLQDICKYRLLFNNYRNTSCVSSSFFLTLFVSSVCWWTDFTEELIEKMPRAILSENSSRIFHEVHATVMTFWYITITASSTKTTLLKDDIYHWHLSGTKRTIQKDFSIQGTVREHTSCGLNILICFVASKHKVIKIRCQCSPFIHKNP